ncbi:MAG: AAA family ATPase [Acidobacteria bacterium]|jgi:hypothetical protein|nr:AAA family ATPase [Acidobacteriota bacterium]
MTRPRVVPFTNALRAGEKTEDYLQRRAIRLLESGFGGDELVAALTAVADAIPNINVSDAMVRRAIETAAKFADPTLADPFASPADLGPWRQAAAAPWIVDGLLQRASVTLLSAKGGTGKSLLTLAVAVKLAAGESGDFLGFRLPGEVTPVAILDAECGTQRVLRRLRALVLGGTLTAESVDRAIPNLYVFPAESFGHRAGVLARLAELSSRLPDVRVVVVDPFRSFMPDAVADENDNISIGRVLDDVNALAKRENLAVLITDHDSKGGAAARGASSKRDSAEILWHFTAPDEADPAYIEASPNKARDPGGPGRFAYRVVTGDLSPDGIYPASFEKAEIRTAASVPTERLTERWTAIRKAVDDHYQEAHTGIGLTRIAKATNLARSTVQDAVDQMLAAGMLYRPDRFAGIYPIDAHPENEP